VRVPLSEAREGCRQLVEKIRDHLACAAALILKVEHARRLQGASLFVLLGFEESGKLLQLIQAAATAEGQQANIVELKDFKDHEEKASLTTDYVVRLLNHITSALRSAGFSDESFGGYLDHLTAVGKGFKDMRASAMFVDYRKGMWSSGRSVSKEFLGMDLATLGLFVTTVEGALEKHGTFRDLVAEYDSLDKELQEGLPKAFREFARIASEGDQTKADKAEE
jgi:AbiV family abortive infection protein